MLLTKEIKVKYNRNHKYYEDLGYVFPKYIDKKGREKVKFGTTITVDIKDIPIRSHMLVEVQCENCKKNRTMTYDNYMKKHKDGTTYCVSCFNKLFKTGVNHPSYNHNLTEEQRLDRRHYIEYYDFRRGCLIRDGYKCSICNSKEDLEVHHLESYTYNEKLRVDMKNGITLCRKCHHRFHKIYGYENFTKENFIEFSNIDISKLTEIELSPTKVAYCLEDDEIILNIPLYMKQHPEIGKTKETMYNLCRGEYNNHRCSKNYKNYFYYDEIKDMTKEELYDIAYPINERVYCIEDNNIIYDIPRYCKENNISNSCLIYKVCRKERATYKRKHYIWYTDYLKYSQNDLNNIIENDPHHNRNYLRMIVNTTTNELYFNLYKLNEHWNLNDTNSYIRKCIDDKKTYKGNLYCYLDDYDGDINELEKVGDGW